MPFTYEAGLQGTSKQLGQLRPANTTAAQIYSPADDGITATISKIIVCNTSASTAAFRIFNDDDGTTRDQTTALFYDVSVPANTVVEIEGDYYLIDSAGELAVRTDTASALTFTVYGIETLVRAR